VSLQPFRDTILSWWDFLRKSHYVELRADAYK